MLHQFNTIETSPTINDVCYDTLQLGKIIASSYQPDIIIGVSRGGLIPAVFLSHFLKIPMIPVNFSGSQGQGDKKFTEIEVLPEIDKHLKILIVDDENDILEFLSYNLKREGYQVFVCDNGKDAIAKAKEIKPQLILLDVMMPELDGIETCIQIRSDKSLGDTLIAFLTARNEDYSQIAGFDAGADDYINKPIKPKVLLSRIAGVLRRFLTNEKDIQGEIGGLVLDREKFIVFKDGLPVSLPKKEFELMALLMSKPGKVFLREEILDKVWGGDVVVGDRTIDVHIRKLREKLGENYIKTIKGVGYKFDL